MDVTLDAVSERADDRLAALAWLARGMDRQLDLEATLEAVVHQADRADLGDSVGLLMVKGRTIAASAASNPEVSRANELQLECNQGPGVEAILTRRSFISPTSGWTSAGDSGDLEPQTRGGCRCSAWGWPTVTRSVR